MTIPNARHQLLIDTLSAAVMRDEITKERAERAIQAVMTYEERNREQVRLLERAMEERRDK